MRASFMMGEAMELAKSTAMTRETKQITIVMRETERMMLFPWV